MNGRSSMELVREFHEKFRLSIADSPTLDVPDEVKQLRLNLIAEELQELTDALNAGDLVEVADALGDLRYVVDGAAVSFGIDLDAVVAEIHRSNLTKLGADGQPIYRPMDGKVLKGPDYQPPDIASVLNKETKEKS